MSLLASPAISSFPSRLQRSGSLTPIHLEPTPGGPNLRGRGCCGADPVWWALLRTGISFVTGGVIEVIRILLRMKLRYSGASAFSPPQDLHCV
jgi:hypothetical protein